MFRVTSCRARWLCVALGVAALVNLSSAPGWASPCIDYGQFMGWIGDTGHGAHDGFFVTGETLYAAGNELDVFDIADPTAPELLGSISIESSLGGDVVVEGDFAYVTSGPSGAFQVIDIADPSAPMLRGDIQVGGTGFISFSPHRLALAQGYIVALTDWEVALPPPPGPHLYVIDVSDPDAPTIVGAQSLFSVVPFDMEVVEGLVYLSLDDEVWIFDPGPPLSLVTAFSPLHLWETGAFTALDANHIYVGLSERFGIDESVALLDIQNPASPVVVSTQPLPRQPQHLAYRDGKLYASYPPLEVFDATNPSALVPTAFIGVEKLTGYFGDLELHGDVALHSGASSGAGVQIIRLSDSTSPVELGGVNVGGGYPWQAIALHGTTVYAPVSDQLLVVDASDPGAPSVMESIELPGAPAPAQDVVVDPTATTAYVATGFVSGASQISIVDLAGGSFISSLTPPAGVPYGLALAAPYLYVAGGTEGLQVVDVTDPATPVLIASQPSPSFSRGVALIDHWALMVTSNGMQVLDVANPNSPTPVATVGIDVQFRGQDITLVAPGTAYVLGESDLAAVDVTDPSQPVVQWTLNLPGDHSSVTFDQGIVYVANEFQGFSVVDVSGAEPQVLGGMVPRQSGVPATYDIAAQDGVLYIANNADGLVTCPAQCAATTGVPSPPRAPGIGRLSLAPNPTRSIASVGFTLDHRSRAVLSVHSAAGRLLHQEAEWLGSGAHTIRWDGVDAQGRRAAAGVYFVTLDAGGARQTERLVVVR